jgi:hypothetical protein
MFKSFGLLCCGGGCSGRVPRSCDTIANATSKGISVLGTIRIFAIKILLNFFIRVLDGRWVEAVGKYRMKLEGEKGARGGEGREMVRESLNGGAERRKRERGGRRRPFSCKTTMRDVERQTLEYSASIGVKVSRLFFTSSAQTSNGQCESTFSYSVMNSIAL